MNTPDNIAIFRGALDAAETSDDPYPHWILSDMLDEAVIDGLLALPAAEWLNEYATGAREEHNDHRIYIDQGNIERSPACRVVAETLQSPQTIQAIETRCGVKLAGNQLRIEYTNDRDGFWLAPHTDIGVKVFTMFIYLSREPEGTDWGTDIYRNPDEVAFRLPFRSNYGMIMIPADNTWHGFQTRPIDGVRRTLIVNYVTSEWRAREQLAFPDSPIQ